MIILKMPSWLIKYQNFIQPILKTKIFIKIQLFCPNWLCPNYALSNSKSDSTDSFAGQLGQEYILLLINLLLLKYFHGFLVRRIWVSFNFTKLLKDNEFDQAEILSCNCPFCHQHPLSFNIDTTSNRSHQHLCI